MNLNEVFRHNPSRTGRVDIKLNGDWVHAPGFWPFMADDDQPTRFVGVGNKNGIPTDMFSAVKREYGNQLKYIYICMDAPYMLANYGNIHSAFDGIFDIGFMSDSKKTLQCNHSMMARSMPYEGFFWERSNVAASYDFSMLTWAIDGDKSKRWDLGQKVCDVLCHNGFRGLVCNQRGGIDELKTDKLNPHVKIGSLSFIDARFNAVDFASLMDMSRVSIFPNVLDAFPKFIIESLLGDRHVIVNENIFQGVDVLRSTPCIYLNDFETDSGLYKIASIIADRHMKLSPRKVWLRRYNFTHLKKLWAAEFNRLFGTEFNSIYYMNHKKRIAEWGE